MMSKIPVYFVPGMSADSSIFEYLKLDDTIFECFYLDWFIPEAKESLYSYALKMSKLVLHENAILVGVSFGGMLVQEMAKISSAKKVIIVSSVKKTVELPKRMRFSGFSGIHKLLPTSIVSNVKFVAKYAFGGPIQKRLHMYEKYMSMSDVRYLDWAIHEIVNFKPPENVPNLVHIHGDKDPVFPLKRIKNCVIVKNGTHTMIIHRAKWFNEHLPAIILQ